MTVANWITLSRLVLAPFVFWVLVSRGPIWFKLGFLIVVGLTDILDGYVARKRQEISTLGKILDPVADKLVIAAVLIGLWLQGALPVFFVWAYILKELLQLVGGAVLLARKRRVISSNYWGKSSSTIFYCGFFLLMFWREGGCFLVAAGLILSVIALGTYYKASLQQGKETTPS
ncbi:MAG TPA: CDP-alcohol phosphatidyltransferase family protein [Firmicutes bacterium]|jgi:cardiolipin synthase|nr:CDP-alcohol phosphatidyltransferase family protein [Bacillota bacterium]HOQ23539.1 CDP-alcohol phosphatidyltransferase family protein [Bacillota bacterium]HPT67288.1 CDP-alcohol phosphatidyltransferase family protein [Bacillota bacterium]